MNNRIKIITFLFISVFYSLSGFSSGKLSVRKENQLHNDLEKVWPFLQTVKVEYELVVAQLEVMDNDSSKKMFLTDYEDYIKDAYFNQLIKLNIRQGKLLLLLIDRELGKTPYQLLVQFRDAERADFWQKIAQFLGADLKLKYDPFFYPEIESYVKELSKHEIQQYIPAQ